MQNSKRIFSGGVNADDDARFLGVDESLNLENVRIGVYGEGKEFNLENVPSSILKYNSVPDDALTIGRCVDYARLRLIWFVYDPNGEHGIYAYDLQLDITYIVLLSSQTEEGLNFSKAFRIDRNARVVGDLLIWTDNNNEPQCINIESGIKLNQPLYVTDAQPYSGTLSQFEITLIKPPPALAPNIQKAEDNTFVNNFIANESFEFAYQFIYYDNEQTVLGTYSPASRLNSASDTTNYVAVVMDALQNIPNTVRIVNLIARIGNSNIANIIKTWDKEVVEEAAEIVSHNSNISLLTFNFYNNITGEFVPEVNVLKPFDSVPIYAKTLEVAKNRLFLANLVSGYDTPSSTSLVLTQSTSSVEGGVTAIKQLIEVRAKVGVPGDDNDYHYGGWYVLLTSSNGVVPGYYLINGTEKTLVSNDGDWPTNPALDPPPTSTSFLGLTFKGATQSATLTAIVGGGGNVLEGSAFYTRSNLITITGLVLAVDTVFKSRSSYKAGVVFYDFALRKCGVVTNDGLVISLPSRNYDYDTAVRNVTWALNNANALQEIPEWAYYYTVPRTLNLKTRYFIDSFTDAAKYVTKDADGAYVFTNDTYLSTAVGIGLDTTALIQSGLGYTFAQGDIAILTDDSDNSYELPVIAQEGNYIIVSARDIGDLSTIKLIYEIYTPYQTSEQEPFFEIGQMYEVSNPGTNSRAYSITTDVFISDSYTITRSYNTETYIAEAMSPNDLFYQKRANDGGKVNFVTKLGQVSKPDFVSWSNTYLTGTASNGLSTFEPLNTKSIGSSSGAIQKLQLTNKMEEAGDVMLIIAEEQVISAYLQEIQLYKAAQTEGLITTDQVIGTINPLKFTCGTINPESVVEWNGMVLGVDVVRGLVWSYDTNGIAPVSYYKMRRFWDKFGKRYVEQGAAAIEALCGFSYIDSCIDPSTGEVLFTVPQTEQNTVTSGIPVGYAQPLPSYSTLPDYASSIQNRFDIYDGQPKMMIYKYERNKWYGAYLWLPDCQESIGNKLFAWKNGKLYLLNENTNSFNNIFGVDYPQRICISANGQNPVEIKDVADIAVEGKDVPNYSVCYTDYPNEQITDLTASDYRNMEGVQYATWFRDRLSPNIDGSPEMKMYKGDLIKSAAPFIMCEFQVYNSKLIINFIDIGYNASRGHNQLLLKSKP